VVSDSDNPGRTTGPSDNAGAPAVADDVGPDDASRKPAVPDADSEPDAPASIEVDSGGRLALGYAASVDSLFGPPPGAATPSSAAQPGQRNLDDLKAIVEALVFASPDPLTPKTLFKLLDNEPHEDVEAALAALRSDYELRGGLELVEVAGGYQIVTRPALHEWVRRLFHERRVQKLSVQALETLAVIAYKQPITAPEITEIRGVNAAGVLGTLLERRLIKISGRKQVVGRPFLYATTREFLIRFGLRDLNDLPKVEDMGDILGFDLPAHLADTGPTEARLPLEPEQGTRDRPGPEDEEQGHVH